MNVNELSNRKLGAMRKMYPWHPPMLTGHAYGGLKAMIS